MADQKVFAGPRIRRMRNTLGITQSAMAKQIGVSPSYLNLIERNQRPLTVQLLLKLSAEFDLDLSDLKSDTGEIVPSLKEVFADPLLMGELPGTDELYEVADAAPNAANGILKLYRAYRESQDRLSDLRDVMAQGGSIGGIAEAKLPFDEVRDAIERRSAYFPFIDEAAEGLAAEIGHGPHMGMRIRDWFRMEKGVTVQVVPTEVMPDHLRRFDKHLMRLLLSDRLSPEAQTMHLAVEAAAMHFDEAISEDVKRLHISSDEAKRLARIELAKSAARALVMPYMVFLRAAKRFKYDLDVLAARFGVTRAQAALRLTSLQRRGEEGLKVFVQETDYFGHRLRCLGSQGFPFSEFGGRCPRLISPEYFSGARGVSVKPVELPNGQGYLTLAFSVPGPRATFGQPPLDRVMILGFDQSDADQTHYAVERNPVLIGPDCRLCERQSCLYRAAPPITRPLALDDLSSGLSDHDFR
ncbi:MAG: short-chain fatty acyl-CoA regulator family protein [Pseudomonadota bacterium]